MRAGGCFQLPSALPSACFWLAFEPPGRTCSRASFGADGRCDLVGPGQACGLRGRFRCRAVRSSSRFRARRANQRSSRFFLMGSFRPPGVWTIGARSWPVPPYPYPPPPRAKGYLADQACARGWIEHGAPATSGVLEMGSGEASELSTARPLLCAPPPPVPRRGARSSLAFRSTWGGGGVPSVLSMLQPPAWRAEPGVCQ